MWTKKNPVLLELERFDRVEYVLYSGMTNSQGNKVGVGDIFRGQPPKVLIPGRKLSCCRFTETLVKKPKNERGRGNNSFCLYIKLR